MKQKATKRFFAVLVVVIMALSMLPALAVSSQNFAPLKEAEGTVNTEKRDPTEKVDIMVEVKGNEPLMEVFKVGDIRAANGTEVVGLFVKEAEVEPTPTPEQPTPTPVQPTPEPEDPPKAGGVSLAIAGAAFAAIGCAGIVIRRKRK